MTDERPVSLDRVRAALHDDLPLLVVHRDHAAIRGRVVAWSDMETDACSVDLDLVGVMEPVVVGRGYLLERFDGALAA